MTPKTQSVCKVCQKEVPADQMYAHLAEGCHEPVAESASTGEPPTPVHMPPRGVTTGTHDRMEELNYALQDGDELRSTGKVVASEPLQPVVTRTGDSTCIVAARPSEPSAPQTSAEKPKECPTVEQLRGWLSNAIFHARTNAKELKIIDEEPQFKAAVQGLKKLEIYLFSKQCTSPQPVSGDAPGIKFTIYDPIAYLQELYADMGKRGECEICLKLQFCIEVLKEKLAGDAPKVEEIARKLHLYHCQERRSGSICPCHAVADGITEGCHCKEETADIASILRPYFPPADQTQESIEAEGLLAQYDEEHHDYLDGRPHQWQAWRDKVLRRLATPASTGEANGKNNE